MTWPREHDVCVFSVQLTTTGMQTTWEWVQPDVDHDTVLATLRKAVSKDALQIAADMAQLGKLEVHVRWNIDFRETVPGRIIDAIPTNRLVYGIELLPPQPGSPPATPQLILEVARSEVNRAAASRSLTSASTAQRLLLLQ